MLRTVKAAASRGVAIGAHPSYPDREGFGRREMQISPSQLRDEIVSQVRALADCCAAAGAHLRYVKPHGALYNVAARDPDIARVVCESVRMCDPGLMLLGLAGSAMIDEAERAGLNAAREGFADRAYLPSGSLAPRDRSWAVLHDAAEVASRALLMAREGCVYAVDGTRIRIDPQSLCIHGDNPDAIALVKATRKALEEDGFTIAPFAA
jgi:5-oxoprolinase (ATP-hydrolysing) subunit A